jgi:hypothetical protein
MFHCDFCNQTSKPGEKLVLITTQTREKEYPPRRPGDTYGIGWEIAEQKKICPRCIAAATEVKQEFSVPKSGEWQAVAIGQ